MNNFFKTNGALFKSASTCTVYLDGIPYPATDIHDVIKYIYFQAVLPIDKLFITTPKQRIIHITDEGLETEFLTPNITRTISHVLNEKEGYITFELEEKA